MSKDDDGRIDPELEAMRIMLAASDALAQAVHLENAAAWVLAEAVDIAEAGDGSIDGDERVAAALVQYRRRRDEANAKRAATRRLRGKR